MAVRLEGTTRRFTGLSTDMRPRPGVQADGATLTATDIPVGSSLLLTDTWEIERWDGERWQKARPDADLATRLDDILAAQQQTNALLVEFFSKF